MKIHVVYHYTDRGSDYGFEPDEGTFYADRGKAEQFVNEHNGPLKESADAFYTKRYGCPLGHFGRWDERYELEEIDVIE